MYAGTRPGCTHTTRSGRRRTLNGGGVTIKNGTKKRRKMNRKRRIKEVRKDLTNLKKKMQKAFGKNGTPAYGKLAVKHRELIIELHKLQNKK